MMIRNHQQFYVAVLFLLSTFMASNSILKYEELNFKYNVTVSPTNGVDSEACYPSPKGGVSPKPCKSLGFAFKFHYHSSVVFYLTDPDNNHYITDSSFDSLSFSNGSDFLLIGTHNLQAVINCGDNVSLSFVNFDNIMIYNVRLIQCGAWHDSTSLDLSQSRPQMLKIRAALYFYNCTNITMNNVHVTNSSEAVGVVMYDVDGTVNVNMSAFSTNTVSDSSYGGGGFAVEFTYCMPGDDSCSHESYDPNTPRRNKNALYKFSKCTFHENIAHAQSHSTYGGYITLSSNTSHQAVGRGGGLSVFFMGDALNNSFLLTDCVFSNNQAVNGGGLFLKMNDNTFANRVKIVGCQFYYNEAYFSKEFGTGGGGLSFSTRVYPWSQAETPSIKLKSSLTIDRCNFTDNRALSGGGVLLSLSRQLSHQLGILVSHTSFESNEGEVGSALTHVLFSIFSHGQVPQVNIDSCTFLKNSMSYANDTIHFVGIGVVYIRHLPTVFQGYNIFTDNEGSALSVIGTQVNFTGSSVDFVRNSGLVGAGIALLGCAYLLVGENTMLNFIGNHAKQYGGAIYNRDTDRDPEAYECFIRYGKPFESPEDWNVSFVFVNNSAGLLGDAIYATDILRCSHGFSDVHRTFCWDNWNYGDSNCTDQVFTMAHTFNTTASPVKIYPGHGTVLPLESLDNFDHNVTLHSVYYAYISKFNDINKSRGSIAEIEPGYAHVSSNYISITGLPEQNFTLVMQTENFPILQVKLNLEISKCPPGFVLQGNLFNKSDSFCRCPKDNTENYLGLLKCLQKDFQSRIPARMWLGEVGAEKDILMGAIPHAYSYTENDSFKSISTDIEQLNSGICGPVHRMGDLCGECLPGYAVAVNSAKFECIPCNTSHTQQFVGYLFAYVGLTYGPIFVLLLVIIFFNFKLASSATMGFILYAQMVGSGIFSLYPVICTGCQERKMQTAYKTIYGIFNLNSLASLMHPFCLSEYFDTLDVICLEYAIAGFPLIMIILISLILRCTSRFQCCKACSSTDVHATPKNTLLHAFISFVLLSYTKFSLASTRTIVVCDLFDQTGETKQKRIYYAGHLMFSSSGFLLPYGILAIFILILTIMCPLLFLLGPLFIDWLMDQRGFSWLHRIWPSIKIHTYLDTFQGYYKSNRRMFSVTYFVFRIVIFFSYSFTTTSIQAYVVQQIAVSILIVIVAVFRPYKKEYYNNVDMLLFLNLAVLNALGIYISVNSDNYFSYHVYTLQCILVWLPLVYIICYAVWNHFKKRQAYQKAKRKIQMMNFGRFLPNENTSEERVLPHSKEVDTDSDEDLFRRAAKGNVYQCYCSSIVLKSNTK